MSHGGAPMTLVVALVVWFVVSLVAAVVVGKLIATGGER